MTCDVVCIGAVFLDLTFSGLARLPRPGEERWATGLAFSPGGMANTAVGLRRLGLEIAIASPLGRDLAGDYLHQLLTREGIQLLGPRIERSAVTTVMPLDGDRALVSFEPPDAMHALNLASAKPRAVVGLMDQIALAPPGVPMYAVSSHAAFFQKPRQIPWAHAVIANEGEALALTGTSDAEAAARAMSRNAGTAVVTLGERGALAASGGHVVCAEPPHVDVLDATGAGDLFAAAYVWADLLGFRLADRLRWATLYAALSLKTLTAFAGAVGLAEFLEMGARMGLQIPEGGVSSDSG
jgi:sugar/nucleoside kinase (ribokinase family)